ncbi:putative toxin-antitoxin system toxin component, PIN family [Pedobacter frigidisoli]|uniref:Putative toxin-antitoxin system toxin component, PIN family n=1 Tax=Pedobacter frigidisoli TaxID=2530455 RepID=A0A4R0P2E9_9SPHI|nr:putative toxin-antitoxin system toxin component, PIN family [Pedobacter frigidisoli]TCD07558.1 putative toxin-antitoxin system toxin component, PIN family [Pedobacter frigidisoli]
MQNRRSRIIIDTNLWISFLITKDFSKLDKIIFSKKAILIFSQELLDEFLQVVQRPKLKRYFLQTDLEDILEAIGEYAEFVEVTTATKICRDEKDNFLLSLSEYGNVDFLLTGDKDLLILNPYGKTTITTISTFMANDFHKILAK